MAKLGLSGGHRSHRGAIRRATQVLALTGLMLSAVIVPAAPAHAVPTFSLGLVVGGPSSVTVGQSGLAGQLGITNNSFDLGPVTLTSITYHPSCGDFSLSCTTPELGVFSLSPTAVGLAGGACAGQAFTVSSDVNGRYSFTGPSVVLSTGSTCEIGFTFNVLRVPTGDALPATPGVQTVRSAIVQGTATATGGGTVTGTSRAISSITVFKAQPTIATQVSSALVAAGSPFTDSATVTGAPNIATTGTVTFQLFGPSDPTCSGPPVFTSTVVVTGNGTAISGSFTPSAAGTYRFVATYSGDANYNSVSSACLEPNETVTVVPAGRYTPLTPARTLDTRDGTGGLAGPVGPGATVSVQITGRGGVPAGGVTAVAMNVTVTQPTGSGFLTLYPTGTVMPLAANLNFTPAKTVPNLVVVKVGTGGKVDMFNSAGTTHVIYDVAGWFSDVPVGNAGRYQAVSPVRIRDTRFGVGGPAVLLGPGASIDVQVSGAGGVPAGGAQAVAMNLAVTNTSATSFLTAYPTGEPRPLAANLNWVAGDTVSNRAIVKIGSAGRVTLYNNAGSADVIVDVNGWFTDATVGGTIGVYAPLDPARILDTRGGAGGIGGPIPAGDTVDVQVAGRGGIPSTGVSAVILNATVVFPTGPGWLTIFPAGTPKPLVSDLNYASGEIRPNLVLVKLGAGGKVSLFTQAGAHVVFDVAGFIT